MANVSVVGASGIVGNELLKLLENASFFISKITVYGSLKSYKKLIKFRSENILIEKLSDADFTGDDLVFFCTPSDVSQKYVPLALKTAKVIDLSSAYREYQDACLCIPEINRQLIKNYRLFASPNCVVSILSLILLPIHKLFGLKTIVASTYQAVSGGGYNLLNTLLKDTKLKLEGNNDTLSAFNVYLHNSQTFEDGYNFEEKKIITELKHLLNTPDLSASVTAVRVPSLRCHSISCHLTFEKQVNVEKAKQAIETMQGVKIIDSTPFAMCSLAENKHDIFCSRIRKVPYNDHILELWVVGDQLLKGAALNAYQIAQDLLN